MREHLCTFVMFHHGEFHGFPDFSQVFQAPFYGELFHRIHHDFSSYFLILSQLHGEHVLQGEPALNVQTSITFAHEATKS